MSLFPKKKKWSIPLKLWDLELAGLSWVTLEGLQTDPFDPLICRRPLS